MQKKTARQADDSVLRVLLQEGNMTRRKRNSGAQAETRVRKAVKDFAKRQ